MLVGGGLAHRNNQLSFQEWEDLDEVVVQVLYVAVTMQYVMMQLVL